MKNPFCELKLVNEATGKVRGLRRSRSVKHSFLIAWDESFEWFNVSVDEVMSIKVGALDRYTSFCHGIHVEV